MDGDVLAAIDRLRTEFQTQQLATDDGVNKGFTVIKTEMREGQRALQLALTTGLDAIRRDMADHQRNDDDVERRVAIIEALRKAEADTAKARKEEEVEATRRHASIAGMLSGFGVLLVGKLVDWLMKGH